MFAVVKITGKQYTVKPTDIIEVDFLDGAAGDVITLSDVLLVKNEKLTKVGKPLVAGASVTAKIVEQKQGEKVEVRRYKHKVRHRRHTGFRAQLTKLEITAVTLA
jgi:large subunit ribosomal protein L21